MLVRHVFGDRLMNTLEEFGFYEFLYFQLPGFMPVTQIGRAHV